jgi:hypothetical protein
MVWLKRRFAAADYGPYMDHLTQLMDANPRLYREFIMVSTKTPDALVSDYYVGLPNEALAGGFDGFVRVGERDLPKIIDGAHVADTTEEPFTSRFHFAAR